MDFLTFDLAQFGAYLVRFLAAFVLAIPVALERESSRRQMGLRTFPMVAVASCGFVLVASSLVGPDSDVQARIIQGLMTGIGFIGGGAILKKKDDVHGTATAAGIWMIGAVGAAVGYGRLEIAVPLSFLAFAMLRLLTPAKREVSPSQDD